MTRRTHVVSDEAPDFLTVDEVGAILRISRGRAYELVRLGVATNGREGVPAERVDKQFRISKYVIEERLGGPIRWPIPGFHAAADQRTAAALVLVPKQASPSSTAPARPSPRNQTKSIDQQPDTQLRLFPQ